jgi:hypothetical protein
MQYNSRWVPQLNHGLLPRYSTQSATKWQIAPDTIHSKSYQKPSTHYHSVDSGSQMARGNHPQFSSSTELRMAAPSFHFRNQLSNGKLHQTPSTHLPRYWSWKSNSGETIHDLVPQLNYGWPPRYSTRRVSYQMANRTRRHPLKIVPETIYSLPVLILEAKWRGETIHDLVPQLNYGWPPRYSTPGVSYQMANRTRHHPLIYHGVDSGSRMEGKPSMI